MKYMKSLLLSRIHVFITYEHSIITLDGIVLKNTLHVFIQIHLKG